MSQAVSARQKIGLQPLLPMRSEKHEHIPINKHIQFSVVSNWDESDST